MSKTVNRYAPCPCHSNVSYQKCCRPYHLGEPPSKAETLMRSRYCAYSLDMPEYVMATTHPKNEEFTQEEIAEWKESIRSFSVNTQFKSLEILQAEENGNSATVTFKAGLYQGLTDESYVERSTFEKVDGRWLYLAGEVVKS